MLGRKETVEAAAEEIRKIAGREIALTHRLREANSELQRDEAAFGVSLAAGGREGACNVTRLNTEIHEIECGLSACRKLRVAAILNKFAIEARDLRKEAETKNREADSIEQETLARLGEISRLQGVPYTTSILSFERRDLAGCWVPRSIALREEIRTISSRAEKLEAQTITPRGNVDDIFDSDDDAAHSALSHESLGPNAHLIFDWLARCEEIASGRGFSSRVGPRRIRIAWNSGAIDEETSVVFVPGAAGSCPPYNVKRATLRTAMHHYEREGGGLL